MVKAQHPHPQHRPAERHGGKDPALPHVRPGYYRGEDFGADMSVGLLMRKVVEVVSRMLDTRMEAYGLTDAQWRPLLMLSWNEGATATQLARKVGCDAGATTRMLDRLEDKGLLRRTRSTDDRRVQEIELTEEGRRKAAVVPYVIADVLNAHLADLSRAEVDQLRNLLERILASGHAEAERTAAGSHKKD
jgi:DNA-binding MarR family transcriptional regulator